MTDPGAPTGWPAYGRLLKLPGALAFSLAGGVARLPQAMIAVSCVLALTGLGRSFTLGGLAAGAAALAQGVASPQSARLVDRVGQSRVLAVQVPAHAAALLALAGAAQAAAPAWVVVGVSALAGASMPPFGALGRARWTALLGRDPRLATGLAIDALIGEVSYVLGPVLSAGLAVSVTPTGGLLAAAGLMLLGGGAYLRQRRTEPLPRKEFDGPVGRRVLLEPALLVLMGTFLGVGTLYGLIDVGVVAATRVNGHPGWSGALLGIWTGAGVLSGLGYGARGWRISAPRRLLLCLAALSAGTALVALSAGSSPALAVALVVAGAANAPLLITGNVLVARVAPAGAVTEAYTWSGVAVFAGMAAGAALGGVVVDRAGPAEALAAGCAATLAATLVAVAGRRHLRAGGGDPGAADAG